MPNFKYFAVRTKKTLSWKVERTLRSADAGLLSRVDSGTNEPLYDMIVGPFKHRIYATYVTEHPREDWEHLTIPEIEAIAKSEVAGQKKRFNLLRKATIGKDKVCYKCMTVIQPDQQYIYDKLMGKPYIKHAEHSPKSVCLIERVEVEVLARNKFSENYRNKMFKKMKFVVFTGRKSDLLLVVSLGFTYYEIKEVVSVKWGDN